MMTVLVQTRAVRKPEIYLSNGQACEYTFIMTPFYHSKKIFKIKQRGTRDAQHNTTLDLMKQIMVTTLYSNTLLAKLWN